MTKTMTANQDYFNLNVAHQFGLEKLKNGMVVDIDSMYTRSLPELRALIVSRVDAINQGSYSLNTARRVQALTKDILKMQTGVYQQLGQETLESMIKLGGSESNFVESALNKSIPIAVDLAVPSSELLAAAAIRTPIRGKFLADWFVEAGAKEVADINQALMQGFFEGDSNAQITRRIFGSKSVGYTDGLTAKSRRNIHTIVRTSMQTMATKTHDIFYQANNRIIKQVRYTATLDGRTTSLCASRDGNIYENEEGKPELPAHVNCRSVYVGVIDGAELLGQRPAITDTRNRRRREISFRADAKARLGNDKWKALTETQRRGEISIQRNNWANQNVGRVPSKTTFDKWFKEQKPQFQEEWLGPARMDLYKKGNLNLKDFVNEETGKKWNLAQLQELEPAAFKRAGLL